LPELPPVIGTSLLDNAIPELCSARGFERKYSDDDIMIYYTDIIMKYNEMRERQRGEMKCDEMRERQRGEMKYNEMR